MQFNNKLCNFVVTDGFSDTISMKFIMPIYTVSQKVPPLACYNFDTRERILIFFGRNTIDKVII